MEILSAAYRIMLGTLRWRLIGYFLGGHWNGQDGPMVGGHMKRIPLFIAEYVYNALIPAQNCSNDFGYTAALKISTRLLAFGEWI